MTTDTRAAASRALDATVVICAYTEDRWEDLQRAVASALGQNLAPSEVIVSIDHNPRLFRRAQSELGGVRVIASSGAVGKSGALNSAVRAAKAEVIALLDDDAVAAPDWLAQLLDGYTDDRILGVGGRLEPSWPNGKPAWFPEEFYWVLGCTFRGMPAKRERVRNLIGANMSFRRSVFLESGGSLEGIGRRGTSLIGSLGAEDTEFCLRASERWPEHYWIYEPSALAYHRVPESRLTWRYFVGRSYAEGTSKAALGRTFGPRRGLGLEWAYTVKTLPTGVLKAVGAAVLHRDVAGLARAAAILLGLSYASAGFIRASLSTRRALRPLPAE